MTTPTPLTSSTSIPLKLTQNNFLLWQTQLLPILNSCGLENILEDDPPTITTVDNIGTVIYNLAYQAWRQCNQSILALIVSSLSESVLAFVISKQTSKEAWEVIRRNYSSHSKSRIMELHNYLHNIQKGSMAMDEYVKEIRTIYEELNIVGQVIDESVIVFAFLRGLPPEYTPFIVGLNARPENPNLEDTIAQIRSHEVMLAFKQQKTQTDPSFSPEANLAQQEATTSSARNREQQNGRSGRARGRKRGRYTPRCQLCGQIGHRAHDCRERFNRNFHGWNPQSNSENSAPWQTGTHTHPPQAYYTTIYTPSEHLVNLSWYHDSGTTHHITSNIDNLQQSAPYNGPNQLYIGNGQGLNIASFRNSLLHTNHRMLKLHNILHVPHIKKNLLYVHRLTSNNDVVFEFHPPFCLIKDRKMRAALLRRMVKDGLYCLDSSAPSQAMVGECATSTTWHNRLGHPHFRILQIIIAKYGLHVTHRDGPFMCDFCCNSKVHKDAFVRAFRKTSQPLKLIHSDLWGSAPTLSHYGFRYYVIFIDDFSKYTWLFLLKKKSDISIIFLMFQAQVECQFSTKVCVFQFDGGGEFQALRSHFQKIGIIHQLYCPHIPKQNGTTERKHRHLIETVLSMIHQASLPQKF